MRMRVTASGLNQRDKAGASGRVLQVLPQGTVVDVLTTAGDWASVRAPDGRQGYVAARYLVKVPSWRVAASLDTLLRQVNDRAPHRNKAYDGTIGDEAHQDRKSDHNPNAEGVVTARDITHDPAGGFNAADFAEMLRLERDPRIKYVIHNGRMFSSKVKPWTWRPYSGADPHKHHVHVSVDEDPKLYDDSAPWKF